MTELRKKKSYRFIERPGLYIAIGLAVIIHGLIIWNLSYSQPPPEAVLVAHLAVDQSSTGDQAMQQEPGIETPQILADAAVDTKPESRANPKSDKTPENSSSVAPNPQPEAPGPVNQDNGTNGESASTPSVAAPVETAVPQSVPESRPVQPSDSASRGLTPPGPMIDRDAILAEYRAQVMAAINSRRQYPATARRLGQEGNARVSFRVARDGSVSGVAVAASSGVETLDKAALDAVRAAGRLPKIPVELDDASLNLSLTVVFSLK